MSWQAFLMGWGSIFQIFPDPIEFPQSDYDAIQSDWAVVGQDLRRAMKGYDESDQYQGTSRDVARDRRAS